MKRKPLSRRDFLKLAGAGVAITVPAALGYEILDESKGEPLIERSPYVNQVHTSNLDGSVPILLVIDQDSANRFGIYLTEILRAEGVDKFNQFLERFLNGDRVFAPIVGIDDFLITLVKIHSQGIPFHHLLQALFNFIFQGLNQGVFVGRNLEKRREC